jgi:hypothetical protein
MAEHVELPQPRRLVLITAWNLAESIAIPIAALVLFAWLFGRNAGLVAGCAAVWITMAIRKLVTAEVPGLLTIMAAVLTLQTALAIATGDLWIFLLHFPLANVLLAFLFARTTRSGTPLCAKLAAEVIAMRPPDCKLPGLHRFFQEATAFWAAIFLVLGGYMAALLAFEPLRPFIELSAAATAGLILLGVVASVAWFRAVLRRLGIRVRFAAAASG